ncbi:MAG: hypothetical protein CL510_03380, partial [Actinobacteria bacterium]|nr:hypothetical protein [Actinomycetota bacterium]
WQEEMLKRRSGAALNWWVYKNVDAEYIRQMLSTNIVEKVTKSGRVRREWVVEGHRADHYWDCETYALALSAVFGLGGAIMREGEGKGPQHSTAPRKRPAKRAKSSGSFWD